MGRHRIGLIGCGGIAGTWIQAVGEHPDSRIELTYDLDAAAARRRAEEAGARAAGDLSEVWAADLDVVIIGTPTGSHAQLVRQAAAAGKHVMCEKPMALTLADGQGMIDACAAAGVQLAIGHSLRFWGAFRTVRRLVAEGAIGAPVSGSIDRMGTAKARRAGDGGRAGGHWRDSPATSGGAVLEGFIHELDFARSVFGRVEAVHCDIAGDQEHDGWLSPQVVQGLVRFASGALVTARTGATVALPTRGYWVAGTQGGLRFDAWNGPVRLHRDGAAGVEEVPAATEFAYTLELADLLGAVDGRAEAPENSGRNGLENVGLGLAFYRSCETGARVAFRDGVPDLPEGYRNTRFSF